MFTLETARLALYAFTVIGTPIVAYLQTRGLIGEAEVNLWLAEVTAVSGMAGFNLARQTGLLGRGSDTRP